MLMMKFNAGSTTFGYNSSYWSNNSLYNDGTPDITVDADYKYIAARDLPITYLYVTESTMTNGYPSADAAGIGAASNLNGFTLSTSTAASNSTAGLVITRNAPALGDACAFYLPATTGTNAAPPVTGNGTIGSATAGAEVCS